MVRPGGQPHKYRCSSAFGALDTYRPAVQPHQLLCQREPDAAALMRARPRAFDAVEALEDAWQLGGRDAHTGVAHRELDILAAINRTQRHRDSTIEGVLEGVGEQVEDNLLPHL